MTLQSLRERVAGATGPDRELDALIGCALDPELKGFEPSERFGGGVVQRCGAHGWTRGTLSYTASVDAALALIERVLPNAYPDVWRNYITRPDLARLAWSATVEVLPPRGAERDCFEAEAPTPALALISALLEAVEANQGHQP